MSECTHGRPLASECPSCTMANPNAVYVPCSSCAQTRAELAKVTAERDEAVAANEESDECAADLFDLCNAVLDGREDAAKCRDDLRQHIEHVRSCDKGSCAVELRREKTKARADKAEAALAFAQNLYTGCDETRVIQLKEAYAERDAAIAEVAALKKRIEELERK